MNVYHGALIHGISEAGPNMQESKLGPKYLNQSSLPSDTNSNDEVDLANEDVLLGSKFILEMEIWKKMFKVIGF